MVRGGNHSGNGCRKRGLKNRGGSGVRNAKEKLGYRHHRQMGCSRSGAGGGGGGGTAVPRRLFS